LHRDPKDHRQSFQARPPDDARTDAPKVARPTPSFLELESVQQDGDLVVSRGWLRKGDTRGPVIVVAPAADPPAPATLERLAHEYGLKDELDGAWAAKPLELTRERGRTLLVLADPGGVPLAQLLGRPMDTDRFLRLAIGLVAAVGQVHRRGLIHKDIRPANVLADEASGVVHLVGFGQASRLPREHPAPEPPETFAGGLAYVAPEQTGRMNRSVDTRSDLYAVGVVLYEMLTGAPSFSASDPMEWVHRHIAFAPEPPVARRPDAPAAISAIILKCLAKTAEDRYQTAAGLQSDLQRCLDEWAATGQISPFAPGGRDVPDVLRIPERLYGREREVAALIEAFDRVVAEGAPELVLVSGYSGVGKSSVVGELHKALVPRRGLFASGKFDQYKRDIPYSTLAQAFQGLIRPLLGQREVELAHWREALRAALEPNGALMVGLVPELTLILGEQPQVPDLPPQEADFRFRQTIRRFVGVFARPEHPLVLFLDDLQWLDAATLTVLVDLATQPELGALLLVGAYRDNEVDSAHPLMRSLDTIREGGGRVRDIVLSPLAREDVGRLLADALHCAQEAAEPLTGLVYDKTGGNPFFSIQFLTALAEEKLIAFDPIAGGWTWDLTLIRTKGYTDNIVDLMVGKLARLPKETQSAVQWLAALGNRADFATLSLALGRSLEEIHGALWEAVRAGLVLRQEAVYAFPHDRVQEAGYSLIPEGARAEAHLCIGRALASGLPPEIIGERIFEVVNQLNRGVALVDSPEEREHIAELDRLAGERAKASTAYAAALAYFAAGAELLADDRWSRRYDLALPLELNRAECEFLTGDLTAAEARLTSLSSRAANAVDQASVACLRVDLYTTLDQSDRAVAVALEYLRGQDVEWSPDPTEEEVRREYERIWSLLGDRAIEELIDLPLASDPAVLATLDVLTKVMPAAWFTEWNVCCVTICRAVSLSLEHGNSDGSCFAYVWLGMIAGPHFGNYKAAYQFGRLGYALVEQRGLKRFKARTYMCFGGHVMPWAKHVRACRAPIVQAFDVANAIGDLNCAVFSCSNLNTNLLATGDPLAEVQRQVETGLELARKYHFGLVTSIITSQLGLVRTLRGLTPNFGTLDDGDFNELEFEAYLSKHHVLSMSECFYWIRKLQARFFAGDHAAALDASDKAQRLLWTSTSLFEMAEYHFYAALSKTTSFYSASAAPQEVEAMAAHHRQLAHWAENCPENFESRAALVGAEIARLKGRDLDAQRLYERAIRSARDNGFVHNEALANEWAGRFALDQGLESAGLAYLRNASACYALWGAEGKVRQLHQFYPQLAARDRAPVETALGSSRGQVDVAALIKATQAISAEIELPRLIETLMRITLQNAGADRGLLLLPNGETYQIEAEARTEGAAVRVELGQSALSERDCPEAVVNYVIRTRKSVIIDDGARPGDEWEGSSHLRLRPPRSLVCLPLLWQGKLGGVLYLENSKAAYAFPPDRVAMLETLAARAAIALENARLYGDLQDRESRIRRLVDANVIGIFIWADGRIAEANDAFLAMVGYDRGDLEAGRVRWLTPPEWLEADARIGEQLKVTGSHPPFEKEDFRKAGSRVPVLVGVATFSAKADEGVAFVLDLTERKQAEHRQKVLVEELNHRVKNTLATVSSIAAQTLRTTESPQAFEDAFQGRLVALSKTHNLLNRTFWTGVSLRALVEDELAPFAASEGRVELSGDDVVLGPIAAVTLGMAFHELAANAAKYGAFSAPGGGVQVSWRPCGAGRLHLEWLETGGPPVSPPRRRGFGSRMIERALAVELRGKVQLDFQPQGLRCTMDMALDHVSAH
jgi:PAS domain S-box-containing protein